jgi:hypothetical protein
MVNSSHVANYISRSTLFATLTRRKKDFNGRAIACLPQAGAKIMHVRESSLCEQCRPKCTLG